MCSKVDCSLIRYKPETDFGEEHQVVGKHKPLLTICYLNC